MIEFAGSTKKGSDCRLDHVVDLQSRLVRAGFSVHLCPTCTELAFGQRWQAWQDSKQEGILTVMQWVSFEGLHDDLPLYVNQRPPDAKPHWVLVQGVGPRGVELDSSRSGRIHRPTLRQYGIPNPALPAEALQGWAAAGLPLAAAATVAACQRHTDAPALLGALFRAHCPLLRAWAEDEGLRERLKEAATEAESSFLPAAPAGPAGGPAAAKAGPPGPAAPNKGPGPAVGAPPGAKAGPEGSRLSAQEKELRRRAEKQTKRQELAQEAKDGLVIAKR
eukprot:EG_transcript_21124